MFGHVHQNLYEHESFRVPMQDTLQVQQTWITNLAEGLLNAVNQTPGTSVCASATATTFSAAIVWHVLHNEGLYPFYLQRVPALQAEDYPCQVVSAKKYIQIALPMLYFVHWRRASFICERVFSTHNMQIWAEGNPHGTRQSTWLCC